ncbi:zinc finger DHHC-type palmitoyltransferase 4 [Phyllostomus discolor]|nr:zinc finger DHHC-type palmitoyltransferase 4 [Phyllostomus discolor]
MDFLVLFLFYLAAVLVGGAMICVCSRTSYLRGLVRGGTQVFSYIIPECLQRAMLSLVHYLFHTRNYVFVVLHLTLQGMVYTEYTWEVFGYCRDLGFSLCYLLLPYLLLVVNLAFFTLSSVTDPGAITKANELLLLQVYEFDEVMFPKDARCPTCDLRKPARSKHCGVCDRCVHRFDHHCVWVNNCIGAWNARYFLLYLLTLTASAAAVAVVSTTLLVRVVVLSDLHLETRVDDLGHAQVIDIFLLVQVTVLWASVFWSQPWKKHASFPSKNVKPFLFKKWIYRPWLGSSVGESIVPIRQGCGSVPLQAPRRSQPVDVEVRGATVGVCLFLSSSLLPSLPLSQIN